MDESLNRAMEPVSLSPQDARVLDHLMDGHASGAGPKLKLTEPAMPDPRDPQNPLRAVRISQVLDLIGQCPAAPPADDLVERTIAHIQSEKQRQRFASQIQSLADSGPGFGWSELMTVAAVLLIGLSLLWPVLERSRAEARRLACANNLAAAGQAFGQYAADHNNTLPRGKIKPGAQWWHIGSAPSSDGTQSSNSAHLYLLVRQGYATPHTLSCPDNPHTHDHLDGSVHDWSDPAAVSFSYQNQYTPNPIRLDGATQLAILADRNPVFHIEYDEQSRRLIFRANSQDKDSPSRSHRQLGGQNILMSDGRVLWRAAPRLDNGDNIWVIRGVEQYNGVEIPSDSDDSFLVP